MSYSIFDGEILFDYTEINLPDEHFLRKFLVEFKLEKFESNSVHFRSVNFKIVSNHGG